MKIEIDYNGAFAVCRIEPMEKPGRIMNINAIRRLGASMVLMLKKR